MTRRNRERLAAAWEERPLGIILVAAVVARALSVALSAGFAFYDDHFSVIEIAQRWVDGHRDWLGDPTSLRSLVYPGLHWALFSALERIGVTEPEAKMLVSRVLHAAWSLLTVVYGYRVALALGDVKRARLAGLLLAIFWLAPSMAVRNLVEVACQPPLVAAVYYLVRGRCAVAMRDAAIAGGLLALAFVFRFQNAVVLAAIGAWLLATGRVRAAFVLGASCALAAAVIQGGSDWAGYGRPFSSLLAYVRYNSEPANVLTYPQGAWFHYLGILAGFLLPPAGLLLLAGFVAGWRRYGVLFWPTVAFVALHSVYPNKQERFILPVLPYLLVGGALGWEEVALRWRRWRESPVLRRATWRTFWAVNAALFFLAGMHDWKHARTAALGVVGRAPDLTGVLLETQLREVPDPPLFYLGRDGVPVWELAAGDDAAALARRIAEQPARPNYVVFIGELDLQARVARAEAIVGDLEPVERVAPSLIDRALYGINPRHHVNVPTWIYRGRAR
jgi:hypothetical protein